MEWLYTCIPVDITTFSCHSFLVLPGRLSHLNLPMWLVHNGLLVHMFFIQSLQFNSLPYGFAEIVLDEWATTPYYFAIHPHCISYKTKHFREHLLGQSAKLVSKPPKSLFLSLKSHTPKGSLIIMYIVKKPFYGSQGFRGTRGNCSAKYIFWGIVSWLVKSAELIMNWYKCGINL